MRYVIPSLLLALLFSGCETSCSYSTAELSEAQTAKTIHPETQAPWEPARTFAPDAESIYAVAKLAYAPDGTRVAASFYYLENGEREIASDELETGGEKWVSFSLSPPENGWPVGQYEVRLLLNDDEVERLPFNVTSATARAQPEEPSKPKRSAPARKAAKATPSAPPPPPGPAKEEKATASVSDAPSMKRFHDANLGFEFEVPPDWTYRVTADKDYLIEGPKGTDAYELSVLMQFISKAQNPGSSAVDQAEQALASLQGAPDAQLKTKEMLAIASQEAPYFVASYTANDSTRNAATFGHTQIIMDHGDYFYWLSYSGPIDIYEKHRVVFEHIAKTFRFTAD